MLRCRRYYEMVLVGGHRVVQQQRRLWVRPLRVLPLLLPRVMPRLQWEMLRPRRRSPVPRKHVKETQTEATTWVELPR